MTQFKSSKQRSAELKARRAVRKAGRARQLREDVFALRVMAASTSEAGEQVGPGRAPVNAALLAPDNSYGQPDFVTRGFYLDQPFACRDCGKLEVWRATQQKWWYEVAKGGVWTTATRCRPCRRRERERIAEARRASEAGRQRKTKGT